MKRSPRFRVYFGLGVAILFFLGSLSWSFYRLTVQQEIIHSGESTGSWAAVQAHTEYLRLLNSLDRYGAGLPGIDRAELLLRFDIMWSRMPVLLIGAEAEQVRLIEGAPQALREMRAARRADGTIFPIELAVSEVEKGGRRTFTGIIRDITQRKRAESAITAARRAELDSRAKSDFLANVSHELRTPLNAIIGFSDVLSRGYSGPLSAKQAEYVGDIRTSGAHLLGLINDILDVSKIEAGKVELFEQDLSLERTIRAAARMVQERAGTAQVKLCLNVDANLPALRADERMGKRILLNLLSNAVKFTPEGGRITVDSCLDDDGDLIMRVIDTGIGIADKDLKVVMVPFGQVDSNLNRRYDGTGLGLPLVRSMAELHGGTLALASKPGEGTTATVRFPASRVVATPARAAS